MFRFAQFALGIGLVAGLAQPVFSDNSPSNQKKEDKKPTPPPAPAKPTPADQRIEREKTRLEQRNKEIDRRLNKQKK